MAPHASSVVDRRALGVIASAMLVLLSVSRSYMEGGITTEVWAYLLLTPIPVAIALTGGEVTEGAASAVGDWEEESEEVEVDSAEDPLELGFDVPVL